MKIAFFSAGCMCVALSLLSTGYAAEPAATSAASQRAMAAYGRLPLSFTENQGQSDPRVAFVANGSGYSIFLERNGAGYTLREQSHGGGEGPAAGAVVRMTLPGAAKAPAVTGEDELAGKSNYLIGRDSSQWHTGVANYARVRYAAVYPGVDVVYYGNQRQMEFDFVVQPRADARAVRMHVDGETGGQQVRLAVNAAGDLVTAGEGGRVLLHRPVLYQMIAGARQPVDGGFVLAGPNGVRFRVGAYDRSRELVIDPTLVYSTYVGTTAAGYNVVELTGLTVDPAGNAYVTGTVEGNGYPVTPGAFQTAPTTYVTNTFISKLNAEGTALVYSTYLNPSNAAQDDAYSGSTGITVNAAGEAYVVGEAADAFGKPSFPTTPGAYQRTEPHGAAGFVTELTADGSGLVFSTLFGGQSTLPRAIALDSKQNVVIAGLTAYGDVPTTPGVVQPLVDPATAVDRPSSFVARLNPTGTQLLTATYLGVSDTQILALVLDRMDDIFVTGTSETGQIPFPTTPGAYSSTGTYFLPGFVVKLNPTMTKYLYSTLLNGSEQVAAIAIDASGAAYLTGSVQYTDLPVTPGAYQANCGEYECDDAFVLKLNPTGTALEYATYLGGIAPQDPDTGNPTVATSAGGIAVDSAGDAYVVGRTENDKFPTTSGAFERATNGGAFLTEFNPTGTALQYSTLLGVAQAQSIVLDGMRNAYISGLVGNTTTFPTTPGAYQRQVNSFLSGFLTKVSFGEAFCSFVSNLQVDASTTREQGFAAVAQFALPVEETVDLTSVPVTVTIAGTAYTVPAGKLVAGNGMYSFSGAVNGTELYLQVQETASSGHGCGAQYSLFTSDRVASFPGITNPVAVSVSVGDFSGQAEVQANILN